MNTDNEIRARINTNLPAFQFPAHTTSQIVRGVDVAHLPPTDMDIGVRQREYDLFIAASYFANTNPSEAVAILTNPNGPVPKLRGDSFSLPSSDPAPRRQISTMKRG